VTQLHRLAAREAQHEREGLGDRQAEAHARFPRTLADGLLDPATDRRRLDVQPAQGSHGQALLVTEQTQQQVFGADAVMAEPASLPLGIQNRLLGTFADPHRPTSSRHTAASTPRPCQPSGS
jgi:hypothetical protein